MPVFRARCQLVLLFLFINLVLTSCLVRRRTVAPVGKPANRPLLKATRDELIDRVHKISDPVHSFQMKVDMSPSVGALYDGQVTDYPTIAGIILFHAPNEIRVIGLDPVVHGTAFDMLSMGNEFRVSIPAKNQFFEGLNDAPATSQNKLENLRPVAFLTSLMINPPEPGKDISVLVDDTNETKAVYILMFLRHAGDDLRLVRNIYFDRYTLEISRQKTFDGDGYITSDTKYADWQSYGDAHVPTSIDIQRPQDGYELVLKVTDLKVNPADLGSDKFVLTQPPSAQVKILK